MNRKQRRAALKQAPASGAADSISRLFAEARQCERQNKLDDAARAYKRALLLRPDIAQASNDLGRVLLAQGKRAEASAHFARAVSLMPQLFEQYSNACATLVAILPALGDALQRAATSWPARLTAEQLFGGAGLGAIAADPLLQFLLQSIPVRDIAFERLLTMLRPPLLDAANKASPVSDGELAFCCALAKQCFINEYAFVTTADENAQVARLVAALGDALASSTGAAPLALAALAMYQPLHQLAFADALLARQWPAAIEEVLTLQLREPRQESELRASIPSLTPIADNVSQLVRWQYEESPYPRWVYIAGSITPSGIDDYLREMFPTAAFSPLGKTGVLDLLDCGCGTGRHAIWAARRFAGAHVLALDLSLASLAYARRKTPPELAARIEYAQGDILKLDALRRTFDVVDASGVLHHMADLFAGWRILLGLLRPGGFMHVGLYSEIGRADVVAARKVIAERGYAPTPQDIRRCRQELLDTPARSVTRFHDYFTTSECRDLLFHVQESRTTIPQIKSFLAEQGLAFIGFEFDQPALLHYRRLFAANSWSMGDLDRWHEIETKVPDTFSAMYQFWVQKPAA